MDQGHYGKQVDQPVNLFCPSRNQLHHRVSDKTEGNPVGDAVSQRHEDNRQERRQGLGKVVKIDLLHRADHKHTDDDQRRRGRLRRDQVKQRRHEKAEKEKQPGNDRSQPGAAPFGDPGGALHVSSNRAGTEQGAADGPDGIDKHGPVHPGQPALFIEETSPGPRPL